MSQLEPQYTIINDATFEKEVLRAEKITVVVFQSDWCSLCKMMRPVYLNVSEQFKDRVKLTCLDVDKQLHTPANYAVGSLPSFLVFRGGILVEQLIGPKPEPELIDALEHALEEER